jgi:transposase-like protein
MHDIAELMAQLDIPPEQLARIAEKAKSDPMAAMGLLNEHMTPELMQQMIAVFLSNPEAVSAAAEQAGVSTEQLDQLRNQLDGADDA